MTNVDQELRRALDVDPSPEFLARVRMRIAAEPTLRRWGFTWVFAAGAAAAAVIVAVVLTRSIGEHKESVTLLASRPLPSIEVRPSAGAELARPPVTRPATVRALSVDGNPGGRGAEHAPPLQVDAPEILVDARESLALRRLMTAVGARQVDLRAVLKAGPFAIAEAEPIRDIEITPISIDPLETTSEGARQ